MSDELVEVHGVRIPKRIATDAMHTNVLKFQFRRYFKGPNGSVSSRGSSNPIPDDDINIRNNYIDKGHHEIDEQEYFQTLNREIIDQEDMLRAQRAAAIEHFGLSPLLDKSRLDPERPNLSDAMLDSATQILLARESLASLRDLMTEYELSTPASVVITIDETDGETAGTVSIDEAPRLIRGKIGQVVNHARNALDYIAWGLISRSVRNKNRSEEPKGTKRICFPICLDDPTTDETITHLRGAIAQDRGWMSDTTQATLLSDQPYMIDDPATHPLARLNTISNESKHRKLTLTKKALNAWVASINGIPQISISTIRIENEDAFDLRGLSSDLPIPPDAQIFFRGNIDLQMEGIFHEVKRLFSSSSDGEIEAFPNESSMEVCLHEIIRWVEQTWIKFEERPELFSEADSR